MIVYWHLAHHMCLTQKNKLFQRYWIDILEVRRPQIILRSDLTLIVVKNELLHRFGGCQFWKPDSYKTLRQWFEKILEDDHS